jgi:hypothetical protein
MPTRASSFAGSPTAVMMDSKNHVNIDQDEKYNLVPVVLIEIATQTLSEK